MYLIRGIARIVGMNMLVLAMVHSLNRKRRSHTSHKSKNRRRYSSAGMNAAHCDTCPVVGIFMCRVVVPLNAPSRCAVLRCALCCNIRIIRIRSPAVL